MIGLRILGLLVPLCAVLLTGCPEPDCQGETLPIASGVYVPEDDPYLPPHREPDLPISRAENIVITLDREASTLEVSYTLDGVQRIERYTLGTIREDLI